MGEEEGLGVRAEAASPAEAAAAAGTNGGGANFFASLLPRAESVGGLLHHHHHHQQQQQQHRRELPAGEPLLKRARPTENLTDEVARLTSEVATLKHILVNRMKEERSDDEGED